MGAFPPAPAVGQIWFSTGNNHMFMWDGTVWQKVDQHKEPPPPSERKPKEEWFQHGSVRKHVKLVYVPDTDLWRLWCWNWDRKGTWMDIHEHAWALTRFDEVCAESFEDWTMKVLNGQPTAMDLNI